MRLDLPLLFAMLMLGFGAVAIIQVSSAWTGAERGILLYERTCPLNPSSR